jgi:phosphatidylglycerophosphate synthase
VLDAQLRRAMDPSLAVAGRRLANVGVRAGVLTTASFLAGAGACAAAATRAWPFALALWLANRVLDGLDGPVARARGTSDLGGFFDIVGDFAIYGGFVVGVAIAVPPARLACAVLLLCYYVSGTALLALSSLLERRGRSSDEQRSLRFTGGLAEGAETIVVYTLFCLLPGSAQPIAWGFAAAVGITALQRVVFGMRLLRPERRNDSTTTEGTQEHSR